MQTAKIIEIIFTAFHLIMKAILRCSKKASSDILQFGNTTVNYSSLSVSYITEKKNEMIMLPPKEFYLLYMLLRSPNRIFTRQQIMDEIWDYDCESDTKTVNVHINRLRKKFKNNTDFEIITIKNLGYKAILKNSNPPPRFLTQSKEMSKNQLLCNITADLFYNSNLPLSRQDFLYHFLKMK